MSAVADEIAGDLRRLWAMAIDQPVDHNDVGEQGFVSAGGASLGAARFIAAVRTRFGVTVPLRMLLRDNATLLDVAALVAESHGVVAGLAESATPPATIGLSSGLRGVWLLSELHPNAAAYNVLGAWVLTGRLAIDALQAALNDVVARHDALRASVLPGARPRLRFAEHAELELVVRHIDTPPDEEQARSFVAEIASERIPMDTPPMLRASLLTSGQTSCLVLAMHHLIADQRSLDIIVADLATAYRTRVAGRPPDLPTAPSFARYLARQAASVDEPQWTQDLEYWRQLLGAAPRGEPVPFPVSTSTVPTLRGAVAEVLFGSVERASVDAFVRRAGVTRAVFFLAAAGLVLARWAGSARVVVGVASSRRRDDVEQDVVGLLVEPLALPVLITAEHTVGQLLHQVRDTQLDAMAHRTPTFDDILDAVRLPHEPFRPPLFRLWFNDLTQGGPMPSWPGMFVRRMPESGTAALFDLNLYVADDGDGYRIRLVHATDRVRATIAHEFLAQYAAVVRQFIEEPTRPLGTIRLPTSTRPARSTAIARPVRLALSPNTQDRTAIVTPHGTLTYRQLDAAVSAAASRLADHGVTPGCLVEIRGHRAGGLAVALLATWRCGATAALVDGDLPALRLRAIRRTLDPRVVVTVDVTTTAGTRLEQVGAGSKLATPTSHVLFTSGSTAAPAGVRIGWGALERAMGWYLETFRPTHDDRVALLGGLGHDPVLRDILVPLLCGGTLVVPGAGVSRDPLALSDLLATERISILHATPALLDVLCAAHTAARRPPLTLLRLVVSSGAMLTAGLVRRLRMVTSAAIGNGYGTTETPQLATYQPVLARDEPLPDDWDDAVDIAVGTGVADTEVIVRTAAGHTAAVGELGEIVIRGASVADGYLDHTRTSHGFEAAAGVRAFRTGDAGRMDSDGVVHVAGRLDRQVNIDGFRVQLEEIEAVARELPAVRDAFASTAQTTVGVVLCLRIVAESGHQPDVAVIREYLGERLPVPAVPGRIALGGTPSVKAARPTTGSAPLTMPRSDTGRWLAGLVREVLGHDIDADQSFFQTGFTSVTILHLHARIVAATARQLPTTTIFEHPTLNGLADALSDMRTPTGRRSRRAVDIDTINRDARRLRQARRGREAPDQP